MTNINLTEIFNAFVLYIGRVFGWMQTTTITIWQFNFTLLELFIGGFTVVLLAEQFVLLFTPGLSADDFGDDSGEDWIDTDYDT